jgi:hypothetical protein
MKNNDRTWEIAASLYPWDIHDEGIESILDNLQRESLVNSVYLVGLMHPERRPNPRKAEFTHNPVRKSYMGEDSRAYWNPNLEQYGRITPERSDHDFLRDTDWLEILVNEATRRNIRRGLEISHTIISASTAVAEYPDCIQRNIYGEPLDGLHVDDARPLCFNNPNVSEYIVNLFTDVVAHYDLDYVQSCMIPYPMPVPFLKHEYDISMNPHIAYREFGSIRKQEWPRLVPRHAGCFCTACRTEAQAAGIDFDAIQNVLRKLLETDERAMQNEITRIFIEDSDTTDTAFLLETPELYQWLQFRCDSVTAMYRKIHKAIHAIKPQIELRLNLYITTHPEYAGVNLAQLKNHLDGVRTSNYSEALGDFGFLKHKRKFLNGVQRIIYGDIPLFSGTGVKPGATRETVIEGIRIAHECGAAGITLGHYDGASMDILSAVGEGVRAVDRV